MNQWVALLLLTGLQSCYGAVTTCPTLTRNQLPRSMKFPEACGASMTACPSRDFRQCGELNLIPLRFCVTECAQGYVCRDKETPNRCDVAHQKGDLNNGYPNRSPGATDAALAFLWFCAEDDTGNFTVQNFFGWNGTLSDEESPCALETDTVSISLSLRTPTVTFSDSQTFSISKTLPTLTPQFADSSSGSASTLSCITHNKDSIQFYTGRGIVCNFVVKDNAGNVLPTESRGLSIKLYHGTSPIAGNVLNHITTININQFNYEIIVNPIAAEGPYLIEAVMVSEVWVGVEIRAVESLHVFVGWDSRFTIRCFRKDISGTIHPESEELNISPLPAKARIEASTGQTVSTLLSNWLLVGDSLNCKLEQAVSECENCRLRMPARLMLESPDWEISPSLEITSSGSDNPVSPQPFTYAFNIKRLSLTERVLRFRIDGEGDITGSRIIVGALNETDPAPVKEYTFVYGEVNNMTMTCPVDPQPIRSSRPISPEIPAAFETLRCTVKTLGMIDGNYVLPPSPDVGGFGITFRNEADGVSYNATPNAGSIGSFYFLRTEHAIADTIPVTYIYIAASVSGYTSFSVWYPYVGDVIGSTPVIYSYEYPNTNTTTVMCRLEDSTQPELLPVSSIIDLTPISPKYVCIISVKDSDGVAIPCRTSDLSIGFDSSILSVSDIEQIDSRILSAHPLLDPPISDSYNFTVSVREQPLDYEVRDTTLSVLANNVVFVEQVIKANRVYEAVLSIIVNGVPVTDPNIPVIVSDNKEVVLDSSVTGIGTQSLAFRNFAKSYTWTCDDVNVGSGVSTTVSAIQLSNTNGTNVSCELALVFETYVVNSTFIIEKNTFGMAGVISAAALEIVNPETDTVVVNCNGFSDMTSITYYVVEILGSSDPYTEPRIATSSTSSVTVRAPRVATQSYSIEVRCVAVNTFLTAVSSTNSIVISVGSYTPPATAQGQNDAAALIVTQASAQGANLNFDQLSVASQKLQSFANSAPSVTLSAIQQVASSLVSKLGGLTTITETDTLKITQTIQSLSAAANNANVQSGTLTERDNAHIGVGNALGILKIGTSLTKESIIQLQDAIGGLFGTLAAVSAGRGIQALLMTTQGLTLIRNIQNNLCTQGVSLGANLQTGSCVSQDRLNVVDVTACVKSVFDLTASQITTTSGAGVKFNSVLNSAGAPLDKSLKVIEVVSQIHGDIFGFDASSKSLLGKPVTVCVYDIATKQLIAAPKSVLALQLPVTPITSPGYSFVDTVPNGAQYAYTQTKWDATNCVANLPSPVPSPVTSLDATCTGLDVGQSTFFAVLATGIKCIPAPIAGCIATNAATDLTQCKCISCGKGYISTPVNNGQGCQKDTQHRCGDTSVVHFASQCTGGSILVNANCKCPTGTQCTGTPGSCIATKNCGDIGSTYECIDSNLSRDVVSGKCLCKPLGGLPSYCDSGTCKLLVKCANAGNAANIDSCGFGSKLNTQTGQCSCKANEEFCSSTGSCLSVLSCGMYPADGASSCNSSLEYKPGSKGVSINTATDVSFIIEAISTSPVHPVTNPASITAEMLKNIKTTINGDQFNGHTMAQGTTVAVRQENPETATHAASLVTLTLNRLISVAEEAALRTEIVVALGVPDLTQSIPCFGVDGASGLTCRFQVYNERYTPTNQTFNGACSCRNNVQCTEELNCGCQPCRNGGTCNWPTHGFDVHKCDCPVGWKGDDCSVEDLPRSRYFDYTFLTGTAQMFTNLNTTEQEWFKGNVSQAWVALLGSPTTHQIFVHAAQSNQLSLEVSIGFRVRDSEHTVMKAAVLNTAAARQLKTVISGFFNSNVGASLFSETLGCGDIPQCKYIPAHWTNPRCQCLEVCSYFFTFVRKGIKSHFPL